jgi:hypothetical protein
MDLVKNTDTNDSKKMTVTIDVESIVLDTVLDEIKELSDKAKKIEKNIQLSTVLTRFFWKLKLERVQDKIQLQKLLYEELKKQYSKK